MLKPYLTFIFASLVLFAPPLLAQKKKNSASSPVSANLNAPTTARNAQLFNALRYRNIGPFVGGRSLAVSGVVGQPLVYYFGTTGGGVWKTTDGGNNWFPISDSTFKSSSVGALAVAESDPNVVYAGMGETDIRGNISYGDGMYKSTDGGKSWQHLGLAATNAIAKISVHPRNADVLFVAALGNHWAPNKERGVYRSKDGGKSWQQVLAKNDSTGAVDVVFDPTNANILYAATWQSFRNHHMMSSGGLGCGLYKSTDGGDTWKLISKNPGLPKGLLGKMGLAVSASNPQRVYAMIENKEKGGLYRSEDGGETWALINDAAMLKQRPWYYMNVAVDPKNDNNIIVLNVNAFKSKDGGKTFQRINVHHGDTHDVWINPANPANYIVGDDGGGEVTYDDGNTFTELDLPTSQFYHVSVDNDFPYNVYGAQQDNSAKRIASRSDDNNIGLRDWYTVAGGESGYIAADPLDPMVTFGGSYDGLLTRQDKRTNQEQVINVYPEYFMGAPSSERKYRFQWTYPIVFSPHDPKTLFATSQFVHKTTDYGHSWEVISPDLTRHDPATLGSTGGPISKDQTGAETYATIFTFAECEHEKGVYWTGSDDGMVHISRDAGKNWANVTPPQTMLGEFAMMSLLETSRFDKGKAYLAATRYKLNDHKPYLFKTTDYGKTWTLITQGIPDNEWTRVVREDPNKRGLLYAGTERGVYVSFNDGDNWQKLQLNLPLTPIHDLVIQKREKDLILATHGRSFWVLDDLTPLHEIMDNQVTADAHLYKPRHSYRMVGGGRFVIDENLTEGENAPNGTLVRYYLKDQPKDELRLQFLTMSGDTIISYSNKKDKKGEEVKVAREFYENPKQKRVDVLATKAGMNTFLWDMRYPDATAVDGVNIMWSGSTIGPKVVPGKYKVRLLMGKTVIKEQEFDILKDPRVKITDAEFKEQFDLLLKINKKLSENHKGVNQIRKVREEIGGYMKAVKDTALANRLKKQVKPMLEEMDKIESTLMQPKSKASQDALNFAIQLNDKLAGVGSAVSAADARPTKASQEAYQDLANKIDQQLEKLRSVLSKEVPAFNEAVRQADIKAINVN
ncbi:MAG: glycosyl hydrolase [Runella slithyformis]|nr:MAG: glycosyl hydrolase [Runella slithyformis]TAF29799.1 MAG: glycosyl hydrolase [Runella slithyformis]TAF48850.1 MAG: glycosyl hydrolase [Runella slithyformis]TAF83433.1 MAG: glycosyl hydrolase [Runella slithyformis]